MPQFHPTGLTRTSNVGLYLKGAAIAACSPQPRRADTPDSTTVAVTPTGKYLAVDADHSTLVLVGPLTSMRQTLALPGTPGRMAYRSPFAVVTLPMEGSVALVDVWQWQVTAVVNVGTDPTQVALTGPMSAVVLLAGEGALAWVDLARQTVDRKVALGLQMPGALAVTRENALITDVVAGRVATVSLKGGAVTVKPLSGLQPAQQPTLAQGITWSAMLNHALVASAALTTSSTGTPAFVTTSGAGASVYYGPKEPPGQTLSLVPLGGTPWAEQLSAGLSPNEPLSEPVATAVVDDGRAVAVLFRGSRQVVFWRRVPGPVGSFTPCSAPAVVTRVGHGADGLAVTSDGDRLVVHNAADLTFTEVPVPHFVSPDCTGEPASQSGVTVAFSDVTLPRNVAVGRRLFFDATNMDLTRVGITCAFCHVDGMVDGRTWDTPTGPRNTPTLSGARPGVTGIASTTLPLHWSGDFASVEDLTGTVVNVMVGDGINTTQAHQLAAYIDTLPARAVAAPRNSDEAAQVEEGRRIFEDPQVACATCHMGEHFTDNRSHALGSSSGSEMQTPVLHNLNRTAPYLHDGSVPSLEALVSQWVGSDRMGHGSHLSDGQRAALVAYLKSI